MCVWGIISQLQYHVKTVVGKKEAHGCLFVCLHLSLIQEQEEFRGNNQCFIRELLNIISLKIITGGNWCCQYDLEIR
jgi:hypothetical protein